MKKSLRFFAAACCLVCGLILPACGDETASDPGYSISFKRDGVLHVWTKGFLEPQFGDVPLGNLITNKSNVILFAMPVSLWYVTDKPQDYIWIRYSSTNTADVSLEMAFGGVSYAAKKSDISFAIDETGDVGGVILGSISAAVACSSNTNQITEGRFRVKRLADNTFNPS
jgi:hypothetical protein